MGVRAPQARLRGERQFCFTFVGFPGPPRAEEGIMGKCEGGLVSREFDAIYRRASPSLEPALTLVNGRALARSRYVGFGKNAGLWHSLSIEIEAHMGV